MMDMGVGIRRGNLSKLKSDQAKSAWRDAGKKRGPGASDRAIHGQRKSRLARE
jgi:hypothetical protein